jgi:hypothetical protein
MANNKNSKQTVQKTDTPVAPTTVTQKAETPAAAPVAVAPAQKGGKKVAAAKTETPAATPVVAAPAVAPAQKGGKKAAAKTETPAATPAPVAATPAAAAAAAAPAQKGGKKAAAKTETPSTEVAATKKAAAPKAATAQKGGKKAAAKAPVVEAAEDEEQTESGRRVRSFKVKLPSKEDFEGRFTGLTPYQAANKALSKYFRETDKPQVEVQFSICESTRNSKKLVYTYVGQRLKLATPVTYKITDGREIVKNFKNTLKKVKKADTSA